MEIPLGKGTKNINIFVIIKFINIKGTGMNTLTIDKKAYVVIPKKEYEILLTKAVRKSIPVKKLSLAQGKKYVYKLIDKWAKEK